MMTLKMFYQDRLRKKTKTNVSPVCATKRPDDELETEAVNTVS